MLLLKKLQVIPVLSGFYLRKIQHAACQHISYPHITMGLILLLLLMLILAAYPANNQPQPAYLSASDIPAQLPPLPANSATQGDNQNNSILNLFPIPISGR
jgi:hypothetical protein